MLSISLNIIAGLLMLGGGVMNVVGAFGLLVAARRAGIGWFFVCLSSFGCLFYSLTYFSLVRKPLFLWLGGLLMFGTGQLALSLVGR
jgi:hypothetical protein